MLDQFKDLIRGCRPLYRTINRIRGSRLHDPNVPLVSEILGSAYGGWAVDISRLNVNSVVYSVGVGEDVTFDLALMARLGCQVHAFDPTPIAVAWLQTQSLPASFNFYPIGLAENDGEQLFQSPTLVDGASFSVSNNSEADHSGDVLCPVSRLTTLMAERGDLHLDLLKMDIEGFEYGVIDDVIASGVRPSQWLIEFHHGMYGITGAQTKSAVAKLNEHNFRLFWVSDVGREYGFIDAQH